MTVVTAGSACHFNLTYASLTNVEQWARVHTPVYALQLTVAVGNTCAYTKEMFNGNYMITICSKQYVDCHWYAKLQIIVEGD
jgi:hypothetical protein